MPVYNSARYLDAAIRSVLSQEGVLEIIAIDDCSSDNSREILASLANEDSRIKAYYNENNQGVASVRNKALTLAKGEYLAFCDSDDILPNGAYHAFLTKSNNSDVVIGAHSDMHDNGIIDEICRVCKQDCTSLFKSLFAVSCLWTKIIKRDFVLKNDLQFDSEMTIGEDVVFLANLSTKNPTFSVIDDLVYYHCQHDSNASRSLTHIYTYSAFEKHIECREKILTICKDEKSVLDFVYLSFSGFIIDFILKTTDRNELLPSFELFRDYLLKYEGFSTNPELFKAMFGVDFDAFKSISADEYIEKIRSFPARERVLAEYKAGMIGFSWIIKYFKEWLAFKLSGKRNGKGKKNEQDK